MVQGSGEEGDGCGSGEMDVGVGRREMDVGVGRWMWEWGGGRWMWEWGGGRWMWEWGGGNGCRGGKEGETLYLLLGMKGQCFSLFRAATLTPLGM